MNRPKMTSNEAFIYENIKAWLNDKYPDRFEKETIIQFETDYFLKREDGDIVKFIVTASSKGLFNMALEILAVEKETGREAGMEIVVYDKYSEKYLLIEKVMDTIGKAGFITKTT